MVIILDLDSQTAVQSFGSQAPANPFSVKSQDTPSMAVYFTRRGTNFDLGPSPGIRFGLFKTGNPNPLVAQNNYPRIKDVLGRVCYVGYPNFNTVPLSAALGNADSMDFVGELRYQTSTGTIARTADMDFTVTRSLLAETILDTTQAAFTVPAVAGTVSIAISNTSWLKPTLNLTIGNGAGAYQVQSITDATHFVAINQGGTGNAAPGAVIPSGTSLGIAPAPVIPTYPDPSILELTTRKGQANGYAGLDASKLIPIALLPLDGQTVTNKNGKVGLASIITYTTVAFTTPAAGANVTVPCSTTLLKQNATVLIPGAGYYLVVSITDAANAVLQNNSDPSNAAAGTTIPIGTPLLTAQAVAGGGGGGTAGQSAFTNTTAAFTVPAVGNAVQVAMGSTAWLGGSGYVIFIAGAGYYSVSSILDGVHANLINLGYAATNASSGTVISSGSQVSPGGVAGSSSTQPGANSYDQTTAVFAMPNAAAAVNVAISNTSWLGVGQIVYITGAGYFSVGSIVSPTVFSATNANYPGNAAPGSNIAIGAHVGPGGIIGAQGAGGAGLNAYSALTASFVQPAVGATVTAVLGTTAWMAAGEIVFIGSGGYYSVQTVTDLTHVVLTNLGYPGNTAPGNTVGSGGLVGPGGLMGPAGTSPYTTTAGSFTMPASGLSVVVPMLSSAGMISGQNVYISGAGYFTVANTPDSTHATLTNLGATGNVSSGTVVASGASVGPAGATGPAGAGGSGGGGGSVLTKWSVTGNGVTGGEICLQNDANAPGNNKAYATDGSGTKGWQSYLAALIDATTVTGAMVSLVTGNKVKPIQFDASLNAADMGSYIQVGPIAGIANRLTQVELFDDFTGFISGAAGPWPQLGWTLLQDSGSGAGLTNQTTGVSGSPEVGVWQFGSQTTGTTALGRLTMGPTAAGWNIALPTGQTIIEWRVKIPTLLTVAAYSEFRFGLNGSSTGIANWVAAFFSYNVNISPNWLCYGYTGSNTFADSGVAVQTSSYVRLTIIMSGGPPWTQAQFLINGTVVATSGGQSWTATSGWSPLATVGLRAGSTQNLAYLDWFYAKYLSNRP